MLYFDNAATTPPSPAVQAKVQEILDKLWANPSSLHSLGFQAEKVLRACREQMARSLGCRPENLTFLSGASEANNTIFHHLLLEAMAKGTKGKNIVLTRMEHASVLQPAARLEKLGFSLRYVEVDGQGRVKPEEMLSKIDADTALVLLMEVNNELGTLEPVQQVGEGIEKMPHRPLFAVDGTQALGKFPHQLSDLPIDFFTASAHKIHGPKGIGLLYVREGLRIHPLILGGGQERGLRSGTENLAYIAAFAKALEEMDQARADGLLEKIQALKDRLLAGLKDFSGVQVNSPQEASPYIVNLSLSGIKGEVLLHFLEREEIYISTGSACSKGADSQVLQALGLDFAKRQGTIRISFSRMNTLEEVDRFLAKLREILPMLRSFQ